MAKVNQNKIYIEQNVDKVQNESWGDKNHNESCLMNWPCPSRIMIIGAPDSGKTLLVKNILIHATPTWKNIFILHQECFDVTLKDDATDVKDIFSDKKSIDEYKGCKAYYLKTIPPPDFWIQYSGKKNVLVIDDIDLKSWATTAIRRDRLNKLFSYVSTHRKLTIISSFQDAGNQAPTCIRRYSNVFVIFPIRDKDVIWRIARGTGTDNETFMQMLELLKNSHETITIDCTNNTPAKYRYNLLTKIEI